MNLTVRNLTPTKTRRDTRPNSLVTRSGSSVGPARRRAMIAEAAYYCAEQRGFDPGRELDDWLAAESRIDAALR
jgi:hypothetical protein